jgi:S-DNA-T family DNA segregation ATPase FtsK/SpoIIIE
MSSVLFRRPARRNGPAMPHGEMSLQEPPSIPETQGAGSRAVLTYLPMALMTGCMGLMYMGSMRGPMTWLIMGLMGVSSVFMLVGQFMLGGAERKQKTGGDRQDYLRYLSQNRRKIRKSVVQQRQALAWRHPDPRSLWSLAMTTRRWERRPAHPDFGELRIGTGKQRLAVQITPMQTRPVGDLEPVSARALRRFIRAYTTVSDQPVALFVRGFSRIRLSGDLEVARGVVRALLAQLAAFHAPEEATIAILAAGEQGGTWEWVKWLPHAQHYGSQDAAGAARLVADTVEELERLLGEDFREREAFENGATPSTDEPYVMIVADGVSLPPNARVLTAGYHNCVLVDIGDTAAVPSRHVLCLDVTAEALTVVGRDRLGQETKTTLAAPDLLSTPRASAMARQLSPYRLSVATEPAAESLSSDFDLAALLGVPDLGRLDLAQAWAPRSTRDRLRVPIGIGADCTPIDLDIKESALDGMGPHGLLIGATGSGKSELLRTLVLALALTHSSETLNFVLVDFKGGATFLGLDRLPHTSAVITNLADEAGLVSRMQDALHGEMVRRQELLRQAGGYSSVLDYERAREGGAPLDPLPSLFVIVDEFSELLATHRDFIELFVMIGRLGRSLGVHLLLASQRLDDGRISQLESHLSYRIGLRTFSSMESRSVIGVPDAYELPPAPGNGYLRADVTTLVRFKAAYVSGEYRPRTARVEQEIVRQQVVPYLASYVPHRSPGDGEGAEPVSVAAPAGSPGPAGTPEVKSAQPVTVLELVVNQLADQGPPAHQVWLPPLELAPTIDQLLPPLVPDPRRGLCAAGWPGTGRLIAPVGFVDRPLDQMRDLLMVDLSGVGGHVGIAGGPQSGKSTLLRSLICALALTHTPSEIQFYCLDFGGGTLAGLAGLPHVGSVCGRLDGDRVNRTITEIMAVLDDREQRFARLGVDSMASYRQLRAEGRVTDDPYGDIFLVVDGWFTLRQEYEAAEATIRHIVARGLNFGVHLLLTAARWSEVHHGMRDQIGTRLELRLGDPVDSAIDMRTAATVPAVPGRGLTSTKLHFLGALPRTDGIADSPSTPAATRRLVDLVETCWSGPRAPGVRTLPAMLPVAQLPEPDRDVRIAIGLGEERMAPVLIDFDDTPHLTVLGDVESGKTNLLRLVIRAIVRRFTPAEARIMVVDYRRTLFEDVPEAYRLGYSVSADSTRATVADAVAGLGPRVPGQEITAERLRLRDWWQGPRLFILVDDYELLSGMDGPLLPLVPFLPQGADIGFHMVIARSAAGASRMSMDQLLRRMQETNSPDLVLSCPPNEGPLLGGAKPRRLPAGRALLCTRRGARLVQTGYCQPADATVPA